MAIRRQKSRSRSVSTERLIWLSRQGGLNPVGTEEAEYTAYSKWCEQLQVPPGTYIIWRETRLTIKDRKL